MSILTDKEIEFIRKEAKELNLALPTKAEELRKILRRLFKKYHPDGKGESYNEISKENFLMVNDKLTQKAMIEYCKKAKIHDYIMTLPKQYDTLLGEGGVNLSGGQKQRIAIARALIKNSKIILFDEATSALDNNSQDYIKKTIDELSLNHTVIIVAHRLSTINDADIINVINEGKLVDSGTKDKLLKTSEIFKMLYNSETD